MPSTPAEPGTDPLVVPPAAGSPSAGGSAGLGKLSRVEPGVPPGTSVIAAVNGLPVAAPPVIRRPRPERLGVPQARRIALAAQGFGRPHPAAVTLQHLQRVIDAVAVLQIDSVNVLSRSHYLPAYSRLGAYPRALLDRATNRAPRRLVEYWAHEASFIRPEIRPLLRFRMTRAHDEAWSGMAVSARENPDLVDAVRAEVTERGPLTSAEIERALAPEGRRSRTGWGWNWSVTKRVIEFLFWAGELSSAGRTAQFERRYDLPERVLPAHVLATPEPEPAEAYRQLIAIAARATGIATEPCLRDYFRLRPEQSRPAVSELVEAGELIPVRVDGWNRPAYLHAAARLPRRVTARALLSPFDSLVWQRRRTEDLFGFRYRLEIYTPALRRVHGYYVLPFLLGDRIVARVDLKAERRPAGGGVLLVRAAWLESGPGLPGAEPVAAELAAELAQLAGWLELDTVQVEPRGDLAQALAAAALGSPLPG